MTAPTGNASHEEDGPDQPPHDAAAEAAVLGAALLQPRALTRALEELTPSEFYRPRHGEILTAMAALDERGEAVDMITLFNELERRGSSTKCGGAPYVHTLTENTPTAINVDYWIRSVKDTAVRRQLAQAGLRLQQFATVPAGGDELTDLIERSRGLVDEVTHTHRSHDGDEGSAIDRLAEEALQRYEEPTPPVVPTGWADLDDLLDGGLRPGTLNVVGARPGGGKSLIALNAAVHSARAGIGVLFASLEMDRREIADRVLASLASVEYSRLRRHALQSDDWARLRHARERLTEAPLWIEDRADLNLALLRSLARDRTRQPAELGLIVADYVQLMRPADPSLPRQEQVAAVSRGLKLLAKEMHVPVIAAAQLNRGPEQRSDRRPAVSDLRESGSIEADADVVMLLHQDHDAEAGAAELTVLVGKHRGGKTGEVQLAWSPHYARAGSLARHLESV